MTKIFNIHMTRVKKNVKIVEFPKKKKITFKYSFQKRNNTANEER